MSISSLLRPSVFDLGSGMRQTDRQTTDNGYQCIMPHPLGRGHNNNNDNNNNARALGERNPPPRQLILKHFIMELGKILQLAVIKTLLKIPGSGSFSGSTPMIECFVASETSRSSDNFMIVRHLVELRAKYAESLYPTVVKIPKIPRSGSRSGWLPKFSGDFLVQWYICGCNFLRIWWVVLCEVANRQTDRKRRVKHSLLGGDNIHLQGAQCQH